MSRLPLTRLVVDDQGLAVTLAGAAPADAAWSTFEECVVVAIDALAARFEDVIEPGALLAARIVGPEATAAWALQRLGRPDLAHRRVEAALASVRVALECYRLDLLAECGRLTTLQVVDTESHHGGRRPIRVTTAEGGRWILKHRPGIAEELFLGDDGMFALMNRLSGGRLDLPSLEIRASRHDEQQSWQRWIESPGRSVVIPGLTAAVAEAEAAEALWHRGGQLAGACAAFGVVDLGEENVVTRAIGDHALELVPIDIELFLHPGHGLHRTMLTADPATSTNHHTGIETHPRSCTGAGPIIHLDEADRMRARTRSCRRRTSRSLVGDGNGGVGYAAQLPAFLRGITDAWVCAAQNRSTLADRLPVGGRARHLNRPTADYLTGLAQWLIGDVDDPCLAVPGAPCTPEEAEQLRFGDVPYLTTEIGPDRVTAWRDGLTLSALGPVLRDAVEHVRGQCEAVTIDVHRRVHVVLDDEPGHGSVSLGLPGSRQHALFTWKGSHLTLELPAAGAEDPVQQTTRPEVRDRLLRLQRTDAALRAAWTSSDFTDQDLAAKLHALTDAAARWLLGVVAEEGWPGSSMVGTEAASAAAQLVQHLEDIEEQSTLLRAMTRAALRGDAAWSDVAGTIDSAALARGEPQHFGTKFEKGPDGLQPCRSTDTARMEVLRHRAGLDSLDAYRARIEQHVATIDSSGGSA